VRCAMTVHMTDKEYAEHIADVFTSSEVVYIASTPNMAFKYAQPYFKAMYGIEILKEDWETREKFTADNFLSVICDMARDLVPESYQLTKDLVIKFVPNWATNAQVVINPSTKNPIVFINTGVVGNIQIALNVYTALTRKNISISLAPYTFEQLYDEMLEAVEVSVNGMTAGKEMTHIAKFGSVDAVVNNGIVHIAVTVEIFMILHEIAHIVLGHVQSSFDPNKVNPKAPSGSEMLHVIDRPVGKEVDADLAAIKWLMRPKQGTGLEPSTALFVLGFYLMYLQLCEDVDSRRGFDWFGVYSKEYSFRWEVAKRHFLIEQYQGSPAWDIDAWFSRIRSRLAFKKSSSDHGKVPQAQA